jgi:hypothetical protein
MYACSKARNGAVAAQGAVLRIVAAHGWVRDLLCANGIAEKVGGLDRVAKGNRMQAQRNFSWFLIRNDATGERH